MDTKRFELTDDEISRVKADYANGDMDAGYRPEHFKAKNWGEAAICKAQVAKVLSMLEPVELEALGDEEINNATHVADDTGVPINGEAFYLRNLVQATINKNQSKGQLYRLRERK